MSDLIDSTEIPPICRSNTVAIGTHYITLHDFFNKFHDVVKTTSDIEEFNFARTMVKIQSFRMGVVLTVHTTSSKFNSLKKSLLALLPSLYLNFDDSNVV
jgi:hypothetical protein